MLRCRNRLSTAPNWNTKSTDGLSRPLSSVGVTASVYGNRVAASDEVMGITVAIAFVVSAPISAGRYPCWTCPPSLNL